MLPQRALARYVLPQNRPQKQVQGRFREYINTKRSFYMNLPDYTNCTLCPRMCHVNRSVTTGYCGCSSHISAARAALHKWEEPVLSGPEEEPGGSGAVFFSGCTLRCCFCQNSILSKNHFGKELTVNELGDAFLRLQDKGAYNINLGNAYPVFSGYY